MHLVSFKIKKYLISINLISAGSGGRAVALECEVVLGVGGADILDRYAALHAAQREARGLLRLLVAEDGDTAVLVLERRLHALELGRLALQRVQADAAVRRAHHRHRVVLPTHTHTLTRCALHTTHDTAKEVRTTSAQ